MTAIRWAMGLAALSLLLVCTGVTYGFVSTARHQDNSCGRSTSLPPSLVGVPQPNPCARTEADGRTVTWLFLVPGLVGLMGACVVGFAGSLGTAGGHRSGAGRRSPADAGSFSV